MTFKGTNGRKGQNQEAEHSFFGKYFHSFSSKKRKTAAKKGAPHTPIRSRKLRI